MQHIYSTQGAFAALKADGSVVSWGSTGKYLGDGRHEDIGYTEVKSQLVDVQHIYSTKWAFAALKADGSLVAWGQDCD